MRARDRCGDERRWRSRAALHKPNPISNQNWDFGDHSARNYNSPEVCLDINKTPEVWCCKQGLCEEAKLLTNHRRGPRCSRSVEAFPSHVTFETPSPAPQSQGFADLGTILECFGLEWTSKVIQFHLPPAQVARSSVSFDSL